MFWAFFVGLKRILLTSMNKMEGDSVFLVNKRLLSPPPLWQKNLECKFYHSIFLSFVKTERRNPQNAYHCKTQFIPVFNPPCWSAHSAHNAMPDLIWSEFIAMYIHDVLMRLHQMKYACVNSFDISNGTTFHCEVKTKVTFRALDFRQSEELTLETSVSLSLHGGNFDSL